MSDVNDTSGDQLDNAAANVGKKAAGKTVKKSGQAAAKAAGKIIAFLATQPAFWIAVIVIGGTFLICYIIKDWNRLYFEDTVTFESAEEYAEFASEEELGKISEEVANYYENDPEHYEAVMEVVQEYLDTFYEEVQADNEERWNESEYSSYDNSHLEDATMSPRDADGDAFNLTSLEDYVASYIVDYASDEQMSAIERGGSRAEDVIEELESNIMDRDFRQHARWVCTSDGNPVIREEEVDEYDDFGNVTGSHIEYYYHNTYSVSINQGDGEAYPSEGIEWQTIDDEEDYERVIALYTADDAGETEYVKEGLDIYHNGENEVTETADRSHGTQIASSSPFPDLSRIGALVSNFFSSLLNALEEALGSLFDLFEEQYFDLKDRGPVPDVTTLQYGSSAYAMSSYAGNSAALAAIELCRNTQYVWGGRDAETGVDCSGLVIVAYNAIGYSDIAGSSAAQREQCIMLQQFWSYDEWYANRVPGDLVLMTGHVAMYVGTVSDMRNYGVSQDIIDEEELVDGIEYCIEASGEDVDGPGDGVKFSSLKSNINDRRYVGIGRPYNSSMVSLSGDAKSLYRFFISSGMTKVAACGLLGNLSVENGAYNPTVTSAAGYYGLAQWSVTRKAGLVSYCNSNALDYQSVSGQAEFIVYEMRTSYTKLWNHLRECDDPYKAAYDIALRYEGCVGGSSTYDGCPSTELGYSYEYTGRIQSGAQRASNAKDFYSQLN